MEKQKQDPSHLLESKSVQNIDKYGETRNKKRRVRTQIERQQEQEKRDGHSKFRVFFELRGDLETQTFQFIQIESNNKKAESNINPIFGTKRIKKECNSCCKCCQSNQSDADVKQLLLIKGLLESKTKGECS